MKISYSWLKSYIADLPQADALADVFTFHLCEVESEEKLSNGDTVFDLKILPDRAHDLLSHQGVARELAGLLGLTFKLPEYKIPEAHSTDLKIKMETDACRRYMGRVVRNIYVGDSPQWIKEHLETIGQRSINNIVDATNIVMYGSGQPCHAFDLDKVKGAITVRYAREGEKMTTLDGKVAELGILDVVIADDEGVLAIAGVKGGKKAEIDDLTKNIILEVANFDPASVRKTGHRLKIFTDSLKRFENDVSPELAGFAMTELSALLCEYGDFTMEEIVDIYPQKQTQKTLEFSAEKISKILGIDIPFGNIEDILKRYDFSYKKSGDIFEVSVPFLRLDLTIPEDMADEIGRIHGYENIEAKAPENDFKLEVNEDFYKILRAKKKMIEDGYSEVMTHAFRDKGEIEVLGSSVDKNFLRTNLSDGLTESIRLNQNNLALLDASEIKVFEIGTVFKKGGEQMNVAFGDKKKITEMTLDEFCIGVEIPSSYGDLIALKQSPAVEFKPWSLYPFIVRDIAVWLPDNVSMDELAKLIKENGTVLLEREPKLFDRFSKDGKTSYAFRMVFQSDEKTLTDEEVNAIMDNVNTAIKDKGWQVR